MPDTESILLQNGWEKYDDEARNVFEIPGFEVRADTTIFEKEKSDDVDGFVFLSELNFSKSIPPSGMNIIRGMINEQSRSKFQDVLKERNIHNITNESAEDISYNSYTVNKSVFSASQGGEMIKSQIYTFHDNSSYYIVGYSDTTDSEDEYRPSERVHKLIKNILDD